MTKSFICLSSLKIFYLCITLILTSLPLLLISQSLASEREILLNIKELWGNQTLTQAWDSTTSPCSWPEIQCSGDETIIGILIGNQYIARKIPPIICDLKNLTTLDLCYNHFQGEFPTFLYNCSKLQKLDLSLNLFVGQLPNDIHRLSSRLQHLDLSFNNFSGNIPSSIEQLRWLTYLELSVNNFSGNIPSSIGQLRGLTHLDLSVNNFSGNIPSSIGHLRGLTHLYLSANSFSGNIPSSIGQLRGLNYLELSSNVFSGNIPSSIGQLRGLNFLGLSSNSFSGNIPSSIGQLRGLTYLDLSKNRFSGDIPSSIGQLQGLIGLNFESNRFDGTIPSELGNLVNLQIMTFDGNPFAPMELPTRFGGLKSLQTLSMTYCHLIGRIPESFANISSLENLFMYGNNLVGEIPRGLFLLKKLSYLNLSRNQLSGELPTFIKLPYLNLSYNKLSGPIPPELATLHLEYLDLSFNNFSGNISSLFDHFGSSCYFQGNPNLCSNTKTFGLPKCSSGLDRGLPSTIVEHGSSHISFTSSGDFRLVILVILLVPAAMLILLFLFSKVIIPRHKKKRKHINEQPSWTMTTFHNLSFTKSNILSGLIENNVIGSGGSGKIYSVDIADSGDKVAVKRIWNEAKLRSDLEKQFRAEVEILGKIRHIHIVKLLCCVSKADSMLLVYEYMQNQSLDKWLRQKKRSHHESSNGRYPVLDWPTRLSVAIGAAKGLCYMHHDCFPPIIHRDVKTSNILLDSEFNAKIADFGLAKMLAYEAGDPHTASVVAGSFGYIAPEYWCTRRLNEKIDIYSFGVVLLELVTGKEACRGNDHLNLAEWSWKHYYQGLPIADVLDNEIKDPCFLEEMTKVFKIGLMCTCTVPSSRPTTKQVQQLLTLCSHNEASDRAKTSDSEEDGVAPFLGDKQ